jgi:hypothetical protein
MIEITDIIGSWKRSFNPTDSDLELATKRLEICKGNDSIPQCESYTEVLKKTEWSAVCSSCGCPINKKIFSHKINPCPKDNWVDVDEIYNKLIPVKNTKTIF